MSSQHPPRTASLEALARGKATLEDRELLTDRLRAAAKESKHLEWKSHPPIGPSVTQRSKCRMVKAALAFANWEGGFIIFGVDPGGNWVGLNRAEISSVDPAAISELINGCIFPEIPDLNYVDFELEGKHFAVLHIPPSLSAPHITTKQLVEKDADGRIKVVVEKHALYCRQGAKSDLATPQQHHQILSRHSERLRSELLRRIREVPVPVPLVRKSGSQPSGGAITFARLTNDPDASAVRLSREEGASGTFLHEELSDGLFDEINNVVEASSLLAKGRPVFCLGEAIYYRVYAERQHVIQPQSTIAVLGNAGLHDFYAPSLYWLLKMDTSDAAAAMKRIVAEMGNLQIRALMKVATLLGPRVSDWLWHAMMQHWGNHSQKPDYVWAFEAMRDKPSSDPRLTALRSTGKTSVGLPGGTSPTYATLLSDLAQAPGLLTKTCMAVYEGQKQLRHSARCLDLIAYGAEVETRAAAIEAELGLSS